MRRILCVAILAALCSGCNSSTRSISHYRYGYNPSYQGEMSEVEFIKDVSSNKTVLTTEPIRVAPKERIIVLQSGQVRPDRSLLAGMADTCEAIPMSGVPSRHAAGGPNLRQAAQAGQVTKIVAYWGTIEATTKRNVGTTVAWVPIVGWFIPSESQKMRVFVSAIVADVESGRWSHLTARSSETKIHHSLLSRERKDSEQVESLKAEAYQRLVKKLMTPLASRGEDGNDAPEEPQL